MSEGTCVLHNGSYCCGCRDGREGPHRESREWGAYVHLGAGVLF